MKTTNRVELAAFEITREITQSKRGKTSNLNTFELILEGLRDYNPTATAQIITNTDCSICWCVIVSVRCDIICPDWIGYGATISDAMGIIVDQMGIGQSENHK